MESYVPNNSLVDTDAKPDARRSFGRFLIETDIKPLVFVGKCMEYFGTGSVVGFMLGATIVYGLSILDLLPYADRFRSIRSGPIVSTPPTPIPTPALPPDPVKIMVRGVVTDGSGVVKEPFQIGVVQNVYGEFTKGDGTYYLEVPRQSSYKLAFWKGNYENLRVVELLLENENNLSQAVWLQRPVDLTAKGGGAPPSSKVVERGRKAYLQDTIFNGGSSRGTMPAFEENPVVLSVE